MKTNGQHNRPESDQPWNQTFEEDRDEHGNLSRVKLRKQSQSHNLITIILVTLIIVVALVALVYGLTKQSASGKGATNQSAVTVSSQKNVKKKSSSVSSAVKKAATVKKKATKASSSPVEKTSTAKPVSSRASSATARTGTSQQTSVSKPAKAIPKSSSNSQVNTTNPTTTVNGHKYATVQPGQGIYRVAVNNGLTMAQLMRLNGLSSTSQIHPNERLRVK